MTICFFHAVPWTACERSGHGCDERLLGESDAQDRLARRQRRQRIARVVASLLFAWLWLDATFGNSEWTFAYHSHRGMHAFARWHEDPTPENEARWLAEKAGMDRLAGTVRVIRVAVCCSLPLALVGILLPNEDAAS